MAQPQGPLETRSPWPRIGWGVTILLAVASFALGFLVVSRPQQGGSTFGVWAAICRGLGVTSDTGAALELQPAVSVPSKIAWTSATLKAIGEGDVHNGETVALICAACHGKSGVSGSALYPTLAGMEAVTIYKQLDDFRSGKRSNGVMNAIATAITVQSAADVAAYFSSRSNGMPPPHGDPLQGGHSFREGNGAIRLVFAGDPARGIPPCTACHGPSEIKLGAPRLTGQQPAYIERQLAAFAQGLRRNDINEQMRTVASQLTATEMHEVAEVYGTGLSAHATEAGSAAAGLESSDVQR